VNAAGTDFELDVKYEMIKPIGHGAYGVVISAINHENDTKVSSTTMLVDLTHCSDAYADNQRRATRMPEVLLLLREHVHLMLQQQ
jgi:hypothetical protein